MRQASDDGAGRNNCRVGARVASALAGLLAVLSWAGVAAAQPAAPSPPTTAPEDEAARAAEAQASLHLYEATRLVNMARALNPPHGAPASGQTAWPLWELERRIVLLEAALRVHEPFAKAYWELSQARREAQAVYRAQAEWGLSAASQARTAGQTDQADRYARLADQANRAAEDQQEALLEALGHYVRLRPQDVAAWQVLVRGRLDLLQDAEARINLLTKEVPGLGPATQPAEQVAVPADLPPERTSLAEMMLADLYHGQGRNDEARKLLAEAVRRMPLNGWAKASLVSLNDQPAQPTDELDLLLTDFRVDPTDLGVVDQIAAFLARYDLYAPMPRTVTVGKISETQDLSEKHDLSAAGFYEYGTKVREALYPESPLPVDLLLEHGHALMQAGRPQEAAKLIRQAISQTEPGTLLAGLNNNLAPLPAINLQARILLVEALARYDSKAAADEAKLIEDYYRGHRDKPAFGENGSLLAWLSMFYLQAPPLVQSPTTQPTSTGPEDGARPAETAVGLARRAVKTAGDSPMFKGVLGAALASTGRPADAKEAVELLTPLAEANAPWQQYYLALAKRTVGAAPEADALLTAVATSWPGHPAGQAARKALGAAASALPAGPGNAMRNQLQALPEGLFLYYRSPGSFTRATATLTSGTQPFGPIAFRINLTNVSDKLPQGGFPITVGPLMTATGKQAGMVWPDILVSAAVALPREQSPRVFPAYCTIHLPGGRILQPGESLATYATLDIGPVDQLFRLTPQAEKAMDIEMLINAIPLGNNQWRGGPGGFAIPIRFKRGDFSANARNSDDAIDWSTRGTAAQKIPANLLLGSLLAEAQLLSANQLTYRPRFLAPYVLSQPLEDAARDADPEVRAFLADAVYPAGLVGKLREAMLRQLADGNWLVRLMTVRLVGDRVGPAASKEIGDLAANDEDPLVRRIAQSYLDQWAQRR